jgi:hypothetical protein
MTSEYYRKQVFIQHAFREDAEKDVLLLKIGECG